MDQAQWPELKDRLAAIFAVKSRDEWCSIMEMTDVCFAPVLRIDEAAKHPHNVERATFVEYDGRACSRRPPRGSAAPPARSPGRRPMPGQHSREVLAEWGIDAERVDELLALRRRRRR